MKICFVADGGSPIALSWMRHFVQAGHEVHLISSRPCTPDVLPGAQVSVVPLAMMGLLSAKSTTPKPASPAPPPSKPAVARGRNWRGGRLWGLLSAARYNVSAIDLYRRVSTASELIERIRPDLVHALRIPLEGILAARATPRDIPLLVSVWGNDFTLFARRMPLLGCQTRQTMRRTDALLCDCQRDVRLAETWGFSGSKPRSVLPGSGGIRAEIFHPGEPSSELRERYELPPRDEVLINSRGYRAYVPLEPFFRGIRLVADGAPGIVVLCTGLEGNPIAERLVNQLGLEANTRLLGGFPHETMADLFRLAGISVSPSLHDGTPNTLLESMACGCFPTAGNIESVREWIEDGVNGLLFDPKDPRSIAEAIERALGDPNFRTRAQEANLVLVCERAEYAAAMRQAEEFYLEIIDRGRRLPAA